LEKFPKEESEERNNLKNFINFINNNETLLSMGTENWTSLVNLFLLKNQNEDAKIEIKKNLLIKELAVYKIIESRILGNNKFNGNIDTISTITSLFIFKQNYFLLKSKQEFFDERSKKAEQKQHSLKNKGSSLTSRETYKLFNSLNKRKTRKCKLISVLGSRIQTSNDVIQGANDKIDINEFKG
jgi:hypothetical protein